MKVNNLLAAMSLFLCLPLTARAQGNNTGMGGEDDDAPSIAERVLKLEKKTDAFNLYLNFAAAARATEHNGTWKGAFANRQLRLEIKGHVTDKLFYRLRQHLNSGYEPQGEDNFAKATDMMMVGYTFNPKWEVQAGKIGQIWGGYEYDENPLFIYKYCDFVAHMECFVAGAQVTFKPIPTQEFGLQITDSHNGTFEQEYAKDAKMAGPDLTNDRQLLTPSNIPLTYIANWNGNFFNDRLQARWAWGLQTQAKGKYSRMLSLGQRLNLPKLQWYIDYYGAVDELDRLRIASGELTSLVNNDKDVFFGNVHYNALVTEANWQFAPRFNFKLRGSYETTSIPQYEALKNYRKYYSYVASLEYFPVKGQNLRLFLAYMGKKVDYNHACGLSDYHTNKLELGLMYRIKCY